MAESMDSLSFEVDVGGDIGKLKSLDDVFSKIGKSVSLSTNKITTLGTRLLNVARFGGKAITGLGTIAIATAYSVDKFIERTSEMSLNLTNINQATGLSVTRLQDFAKTTNALSGVSFDTAISQVEGLHNTLMDIKMLKGDAMPFMRLGINPYEVKDAFDLIEKIRGAIVNIPQAARGNILQTLGFNQDMIRTIMQGGKSLGGIMRSLSPKQMAQIDRMGTSIRKLKVGFSSLKDQAVATLAPKLNMLFERGFSWLSKNGNSIISIINKIVIGFAWFSQAVGSAFSILGNFLQRLMKTENGFKTLLVVVGLLALAFSPMLIALGLLVLVLDDIAVWSAGGKSLFGGFYEGIAKFTDKIKSIKSISDIFNVIKDSISSLHEKFPMMMTAIEAITAGFLVWKTIEFSKMAIGLFKMAKGLRALALAEGLKNVLSSKALLVTLVGGAVGLAVDHGVRGKDSLASKGLEEIKDLFSVFDGGEDESKNDETSTKQQELMLKNGSLTNSNQNTSNNSDTTINQTFNVKSASDASKIANETLSGITRVNSIPSFANNSIIN